MLRNGRSNYCHSQTMDIDVVQEDVDDDGLMPDTALKELIRSFANWIYSQLEAESDYLHSDEHVDERLADEDFDETGETV